MSAVYKLITTRATLNDIAWIEHWASPSNYPLVPFTNYKQTHEDGVISVLVEEATTWADISTRINELRPDIKAWLLSKVSDLILIDSATSNAPFYISDIMLNSNITVIENYLTNPELNTTIPFWNPFVLTSTITHTCDSVATMAHQYNTVYSRELADIRALAASLNNTIVEEFYDNGVKIDTPAGL